MNNNEMRMLFEVINEIEEEYNRFNEYRKENEQQQLSLEQFLLLRHHALDLVRMENSNQGDLFTIPNSTK